MNEKRIQNCLELWLLESCLRRKYFNNNNLVSTHVMNSIILGSSPKLMRMNKNGES